jgi:hypothetical protein
MTTKADRALFARAGSDPGGRSGHAGGAQIVGGVVPGLGLASAVGLDPGLLFAAYTAGLGLVLLCVGRLLLEEPGSSRPANTYPRPRPPLGRVTGPTAHRQA